MNAYLVHPAQWRQDKIHVAKAYEIGNGTPSGTGGVNLSVEYTAVGEIDSSLRFASVAPAQSIVREDYSVVLDNKYLLPARGSVPAKELIGPSRWRIKDAPSEPWISVSAAIRYVTQMRDSANDPDIKKNAEKTLGILRNYHGYD